MVFEYMGCKILDSLSPWKKMKEISPSEHPFPVLFHIIILNIQNQ